MHDVRLPHALVGRNGTIEYDRHLRTVVRSTAAVVPVNPRVVQQDTQDTVSIPRAIEYGILHLDAA